MFCLFHHEDPFIFIPSFFLFLFHVLAIALDAVNNHFDPPRQNLVTFSPTPNITLHLNQSKDNLRHPLLLHSRRTPNALLRRIPPLLPSRSWSLPRYLPKTKTLGLNTVSFYVKWGLLEGKPGRIVTSRIFSLDPFFAAAKKAGIYLITRLVRISMLKRLLVGSRAGCWGLMRRWGRWTQNILTRQNSTSARSLILQ